MANQNTRPAAARGHAAATPAGTAGIRPADIYYILFRHKWKILIVSLIGIIAAAVVWVRWPHYFQSSAELLIKYIQDAKSPTPNADMSFKPSDDIINPELELLRSRDLAERVVDVLTPKTILAKVDGSSDRDEAIGVVAGGIMADSVNRSSVIYVAFKHSDPTIVQPVLTEVIASYFKLHEELHKIGELDVPLQQEAVQARNSLLETESDLRSIRTNAGIISLEDTKKAYSLQMNDIRLQLSEANAEYRERKEILDQLVASQHAEPTGKTNDEPMTADLLEEYRQARHQVEFWRKQQSDAEVTYVEGSTIRTNIEARVIAAEKAKKDLEEKNPALLSVAPTANEADITQRGSIAAQSAYLKNLEIKIKVLYSRMSDIEKGVGTLSDYEEKTTDLERKHRLDEETYAEFSRAVANARIADRFRNNQVWNISSIQKPTPPAWVSPGKKTKTVGMILFAAIGGILGLVFFIEMYLDQSLKRPSDVENALHLPLFLNIPLIGKNGKTRTLGRARKVPLLENGAERPALTEGAAANGDDSEAAKKLALQVNAEVEPPAWDSRHVLRTYSEALRDRLITYFEVHNLHHKPKLVAVTSCSEKAGVSTIAAGLAASLSETGEGNVLLVDMNEMGAAHQFYKGELACGIDDALEKDKRNNALVQDNLYVVMEETGNDTLPRALPKRFKHLVPRLRASDYDYIIFDMPPVSQISVTPRLARFMDIMLMVVESEKTDRDLVKRATSLLTEAETHVGIVLNKTKNYVPSRLVQGL